MKKSVGYNINNIVIDSQFKRTVEPSWMRWIDPKVRKYFFVGYH